MTRQIVRHLFTCTALTITISCWPRFEDVSRSCGPPQAVGAAKMLHRLRYGDDVRVSGDPEVVGVR